MLSHVLDNALEALNIREADKMGRKVNMVQVRLAVAQYRLRDDLILEHSLVVEEEADRIEAVERHELAIPIDGVLLKAIRGMVELPLHAKPVEALDSKGHAVR